MNIDSVHVERWGASGPRLVLVHGGVQGSHVGGVVHFPRQEELAREGVQMLVPDRPGHGLSPDPGRPDDAEADGAWVAEMLGDDGAHLVGHSFGGCVALAAAARRPEAVRSLTLIEPAVLALAADRPEVRRMLFGIVRASYLSFSDLKRIERFTRLLNIPAAFDGADVAENKRMGRALRRIKLPRPPALKAQLATVRRAGTPFLVVTGGWSPAFERAADVAAELGGGRRLVIASPHHFPQGVSGEFNQAVLGQVRQGEARVQAA